MSTIKGHTLALSVTVTSTVTAREQQRHQVSGCSDGPRALPLPAGREVSIQLRHRQRLAVRCRECVSEFTSEQILFTHCNRTNNTESHTHTCQSARTGPSNSQTLGADFRTLLQLPSQLTVSLARWCRRRVCTRGPTTTIRTPH
jgi:hypothetical protein